ncbi:DUF3471 domain-containing protein [Cytophagaceae bacterium YF14B1]|uniref:DUF3471 domain-containing protein n=1 Tax=Xanthocytophaga flava TaxID=3048013 RepID=A0AAE3QVL0_9BACT|nr:DUF3471 domain-containing protein [Xanthocytophaga flavus]MDJ1484075.1 DUF3471 domain-containing protein [Xanthocytophaga flavus]
MQVLRTLTIFVFFLAVYATSVAQSSGNKPDDSKPDSVAILQEYVGTYNVKGNNDFSKAIVTLEGGKLYGHTDTQTQVMPLSPTKVPDVFSITSPDNSVDVTVTFLRNETKKVSSIKIYYNGLETRGEKEK